MADDDDFMLNTFIGKPQAPKPSPVRAERPARAESAKKPARGGRGGGGAGAGAGAGRGGARSASAGGARPEKTKRVAAAAAVAVPIRNSKPGVNSRPAGSRGAEGHAAELAREKALKRKRGEIDSDDDGDRHDDGVTLDKDGNAVMYDAEGAEPPSRNGNSRRGPLKTQAKQPRRDGQTSVSSTAAQGAEGGAAAAAGEGAPAAAAASSAPGAAGASKKFVRAAPKPLPRIVRHETAQLDARALRPVTPSSTALAPHLQSVFGEVDAASGSAGPDSKDGVKREEGALVPSDGPARPQLPLPTTGFGALGLSERLLRTLVEKLELRYPTKIQKEGIPLLLGQGGERRDALVKSETGSGKTLTYLIPIVERLTTEDPRPDRSQGTRALILSPTRELVLQILGVLQRLLDKAGFFFLVAGMIMGGEKRQREKARLRKGVHVLICTPGRLLDHLEHTECLVLDRLSFFVLDEADRLMDMGFERDLAKIVSLLDEKATAKPAAAAATPAIVDPRTGLAIQSARTKAALAAAGQKPTRRQNILVSATLNAEIEKMASITLKDPVLIGFKTAAEEESLIKDEEGNALVNANAASQRDVHDTSIPVGLVQQYLQVEHRHKIVALGALLRKKVVEAEINGTHFKAVVFFSTCASVEFHHSLFTFSYWPYDRNSGGSDRDQSALLDTQLLKLHGNLTQQERTKTYQQFCKNAEGILLCTDVAARGLDLPAVDYILQYDPPEDTSDYIHRVGRTARMGRRGQAMLFLTSEEMDYLTILKERAILPEPLSFAHILQSLHSDAAKNRIYDDARGGTPAGAILQKQFEALVAAQPALKESAINAYHSYLRAYAAYPKALKAIFHPRKLHIGHVARSFALQDAPTLLAKSEIVSKQRAQDARDKEREAERRDMAPGGGDDVRSAAASKNATMNARKKLVPTSAAPVGPLGAKQVSRLHNAAQSAGAAAHAARAPASDSAAAIVASISAGVQPAFGQRDRARNVAAQASDAGFQERLLKRAKKEKKETSNIGWRIGTETSGGGKAGKLARTGIDRARSNKVAAVFKKKKIDMVSEFAS